MEEITKQKKKTKSLLMIDMTKGNTLLLLLLFALPMFVGNVFQQLYNLADSVIVGKLVGSDALAAVGATNSVNFLFFAICNGFGSGGGIITSQAFGKGDEKEIRKSIVNTGYIMLLFPIVVGVTAFLLAKPILLLMSTPANILNDSIIYMQIMCVGLIFVALYNFSSSMLRALGDSVSPLFFLIFSCFLNIGLDIWFVAGFGWGVPGAGFATILAQFISGIGCMGYALLANPYFKFKKEDMKVDMSIMRSIVKLGVPLSFQFSLIAISCMALQRVVNSFDNVAIVSAFTATSRIEQLIHQPYQTLSAALSTYTGQNYGASKNDRVIKGYRTSLIVMLVFTVIMVPVMQFFGKPIMSLFVNDITVIEMGATALRISSWFYIFLGAIYVIRGILNGLGDAVFAVINGVVEVIGRFTVPILLTSITFIGIWGIWWSVGVVWFLSGFTAWLRYLSFSKKTFKKTMPSGDENLMDD